MKSTTIELLLTRRSVLFAAAAMFATQARAADTSALAFVKAIYSPYTKPDTDGVLIDSGPKLRRYFEPRLAEVMNKDQEAAARHHEVGALDFDPFIDAQDWGFKQFDVAMKDSAPGKATATVTFGNLGHAKTIVLDLVKIKNDWRIYDITWPRDGKPATLRGLFKLKPAG
jgi:Protein of unknown function (DUF3828)